MDLCLSADFILLGADFSWFSLTGWWAVAQVVFGLGAVIFVHELGHFLVAKACGVKCEKFYLGFDMFEIKIGNLTLIPRSLAKWKWGETVYGIGIVPLGGYVKMLGQDDNPSKISEERQRSLAENGESDAAGDEGPVDRTVLDPRSYQAKTVLQRMAIISAGVIMNLIFAVIFATIAFSLGVRYQPTYIGSTLPGSPGWQADMNGIQITSVDGRSTTDSFYRNRDLIEHSVMTGENPIKLMVKRRDPVTGVLLSQPEELLVTPRKGILIQAKDFALIGVQGVNTNQVAQIDPILKGHAASRASVEIQGGDILSKVNGVEIIDGMLLTRELTRSFDKDVEVLLVRQISDDECEELTTVIPKNPVMETGLIMEIGPITGVQDGSPAAVAGLRIGDTLVSLDGRPVDDPFTLAQRMTRIAREDREIDVVVQRESGGGNKNDVTLKLQPRLPRHNSIASLQDTIACDPLGIAFEVTRIIKSIKNGSPADDLGLKPGDELVKVEFELTKEMKNDRALASIQKPIDFTKGKAFWPAVRNGAIQYIRPGVPIRFTVLRGDIKETFTVSPRESKTEFLETRGIALKPFEETYTAKSLWEAIVLGTRQTWEDMGRVFKFLNKLITGDVPITGLGGPGTIAQVATMEATEGTSRLLLFLTLLSANLAIVNFLPIPVLDGGHMLFLAYEGIFRRPVNEKTQIILTYAGLLFVISLMVFVIGLDVFRFVGG